MLVSDKTFVIINGSNLKHYQNFFKHDLKVKEKIEVDVKYLTPGSRSIINLRCDSCSIEKEVVFCDYYKLGYSNGEYLCKKCKLKKNNLEKFGVENVFQLESVKEKSKKTNLEKRGVEFISQSKEVQIKIKKGNLDKYGSEHHLRNPKILEKQKLTNIEKWGFENVSKNHDIKEKKKETNLKNWGSTNNKKSEIFRKKNFKVAKHPNYVNYIKDGTSLFKCDNSQEHRFEIGIDVIQKRIKYNTVLCTICNPIDKHQSGKEIKLFNFIKSIYNDEIIQNFKIDRKEIDIYLPRLKIGFEFNGVYWHSDVYKSKSFHKEKSDFFNSNGIHIFHIWEDDWIEKENIIKSQISNIIGLSKKIGARKCEVKEVKNVSIVKDFLNQNHIQGSVNSKIKIGLFFNDELVSIMTFDQFEGRTKMKENEWNLNRFCNKSGFSVVGGASKLLNFFIERYKPKRIISYSDKDWSRGDLYQKLQFKKVSETNPDYKYLVDFKRIHKSNFKKSITGISESNLDLPKVWDCGKIKWEITLQNI